jgi:hypothetical protein
MDSLFMAKMAERRPADTARFLRMAYRSTPEAFILHTPDEVLIGQIGEDSYIALGKEGLVPMVAAPLIVLGKI